MLILPGLLSQTPQPAGPTGAATPPAKADAKESPKPDASAADAAGKDSSDKKKEETTPSPSKPPQVTDIYPIDINKVCQPDSGHTCITNAGRITSILKGTSIPGVGDILVENDHTLLFLLNRYDLKCPGTKPPHKEGATAPAPAQPPSPAHPAGGGSAGQGSSDSSIHGQDSGDTCTDDARDKALAKLKTDLNAFVKELANFRSPTSEIVNLPSTVKPSSIADAAKLIPGVVAATVVGDTNIFITYDENIPEAKSFVEKLNQPLPPRRYVDSDSVRLYYIDGDAAGTAVANVVKNMYPDIHAEFVSPDTIQLSMIKVEHGAKPPDQDRIRDARRTIARLDQPRPRASLDAWAIQIASEDPGKLELVTPRIEQITSAYNQAMRESILNGWKRLITSTDLDPMFRNYISYVAVSNHGRQCCGIGADREKAINNDGLYALGYETMFNPITPDLIDMLVNLVAQKKPHEVTTSVIDAMEGPMKPDVVKFIVPQIQARRNAARKKDTTSLIPPPVHPKTLDSVETVPNANPEEGGGLDKMWCRQRDAEIYRAYVDRQHHIEGKFRFSHCSNGTCEKNPGVVVPPRVVLSCVRKEMDDHLFRVIEPQPGEPPPTTSEFGQMRAAIADFLYQYKLMVLYPDAFHSYLEPLSADTLDMALQPVIDAFYDDFGAYQEAMQKEIYALLRSEGISYSSSGLVSMKMIAGNPGKVDTLSQNAFPVSQTPSAVDVTKAVAKLKTDPAEGAADLFKALQPAPVTAYLGKALTLSSTVHSLSGATGMELDLNISSAENAAPKLAQSATDKTPVTTSDDLNSRVATHTVQTKVRVDNLKLFEVSTMRSLVARGQAPWKPVDPVVEIPLLGKLINHPRKPLSVYTQSLIFIDALVLPTAIDLGYGVPITADTRTAAAGGKAKTPPAGDMGTPFQSVTALRELADDNSQYAIESFHKKVVLCLSRQYLFQPVSTSDKQAKPEIQICGCNDKSLEPLGLPTGSEASPSGEKANDPAIMTLPPAEPKVGFAPTKAEPPPPQ